MTDTKPRDLTFYIDYVSRTKPDWDADGRAARAGDRYACAGEADEAED